MMRRKPKSLDDFFARENGTVGGKQQDICDISLCTATTKQSRQKPATLCTWKKNPNAFKMDPRKMRYNTLSSFSKPSSFRQDMLLMSVEEENTKKISETVTSSFGGVTLGMAQILYTPDVGQNRDKGIEERTDIEIAETTSATDDDCSVGGFEVTIDSRLSSISSLGRRGARMMKEAKLVEEKVRNEECKIAEQRRLLDMEHSEFQSLLREFQRAEERRRVEEAKLAERRRLLKEAYLKEQERLMKEEERLEEESKEAAEATQRILDEARSADRDGSFDAQISRSLSCVHTLGVLSETTWENYDSETFENEYDEVHTSLGKHHWKEIEASLFKVRGKSYMSNRKKVPSKPNLFRLITVDLVEVAKPIMTGFCTHPKERVQRWLQQERSNPSEAVMPAFVFCINLVLPGPPNYHLVMYFAIDDLAALGLENNGRFQKPYSSPLRKFLFGSSDDFRNKTLKMIPRVKEGSFLLKTAVGTKPFILGKYLDQKFIQGDRFLEVIADVGSSSTFQKLLRMTSNYNSKLVGAMAFVLEVSDEACLPENIMCSIELTNQDFDGKIRFVDEAS